LNNTAISFAGPRTIAGEKGVKSKAFENLMIEAYLWYAD
jgi:hypothetical protein